VWGRRSLCDLLSKNRTDSLDFTAMCPLSFTAAAESVMALVAVAAVGSMAVLCQALPSGRRRQLLGAFRPREELAMASKHGLERAALATRGLALTHSRMTRDTAPGEASMATRPRTRLDYVAAIGREGEEGTDDWRC
jgi:hypothetical protein